MAFPTETVYGVGANALDDAAVARIYEAKGRPATSPLIVHVDSIEMARGVVREWPDGAEQLARRFWPGPLTIVLPKADCVPDRVSAGLPTVGLRMPRHPVALDLIRRAGVPIAAPSANVFTALSPTTAAHVRESLGDRVAMVLDGGECEVGIESTVISLAGPEPLLLRPGMISQPEVEQIVGPMRVVSDAGSGPHPSPGMHARHYSPRTPLLLLDGAALPPGRGALLWIATPLACARAIRMPAEPDAYAARIYEVLHQLDAEGLDWIAVERPPSATMWAGIADRLERAAAK